MTIQDVGVLLIGVFTGVVVAFFVDTLWGEGRRSRRVLRILCEWANKTGHERCWYYPDLFRRLANLHKIPLGRRQALTREEFEAGCRRYADEEFGIGGHTAHDAVYDHLREFVTYGETVAAPPDAFWAARIRAARELLQQRAPHLVTPAIASGYREGGDCPHCGIVECEQHRYRPPATEPAREPVFGPTPEPSDAALLNIAKGIAEKVSPQKRSDIDD